jgi:hypothetical protein
MGKTLEEIKEMNLKCGDPIELTTDFIELVKYIGINFSTTGPRLMVKQEALKDGTIKRCHEYPFSEIDKIRVLEYKK